MTITLNCSKLRLAMFERNISPKTLAKRTGLNYDTLIMKLSKETYTCNTTTLDKITDALNRQFEPVNVEEIKES